MAIMEPENLSSLVKPLLKLYFLEFSISPWGCTGILKVLSPSRPLGIQRAPLNPSVHGDQWRPADEGHTRRRSLRVPPKELSTHPQCYPASFEYSSFQINCRKTRIAKTWRGITWPGVHVINLQISESHPRVAEWEPPRVGSRNLHFGKVIRRWALQLQDVGSTHHTHRTWGGKGNRKREAFVAMEERVPCSIMLFKISQVIRVWTVYKGASPLRSSFKGGAIVELRSKSREVTVPLSTPLWSPNWNI